jgi:hypothetical protein
MKNLIQIILKTTRQLYKIFYKIKLIKQKNLLNTAKSRKVGRNSHGFPTFLD